MPLLLPLPPLLFGCQEEGEWCRISPLMAFFETPSPPLSCCLSVVAPLPRICPSIHTQLCSSSWLCSCYKVGFDLESFASLVFLFGRTGAGSTHAFTSLRPEQKPGRGILIGDDQCGHFLSDCFHTCLATQNNLVPKLQKSLSARLTGEIELNHSNLILLSCLSISAYDRRACWNIHRSSHHHSPDKRSSKVKMRH